MEQVTCHYNYSLSSSSIVPHKHILYYIVKITLVMHNYLIAAIYSLISLHTVLILCFSWNHFGCDTALITEDLFMEMADALVCERVKGCKLKYIYSFIKVTSGMKDAGYEYINLDGNFMIPSSLIHLSSRAYLDCWIAKTRDAQGFLQPDPTVCLPLLLIYIYFLAC
jgi:hypothetical protein